MLLAVGRSRDAEVRALVERYARRLPWRFETIEVVARGGRAKGSVRDAEADAVLASVPEGAALIALDEHGELLTSRAFAGRLATWREAGTRTVALAIGGADGHGPALLARADLRLSFGRLTFAHEIVRVLAAEQVYRAWTILSNHPYHRD